MQGGKVFEHFAGPRASPGAAILEHDSDAGHEGVMLCDGIHAKHSHRAALRLSVPLADFECGGIAGPVAPQNCSDDALGNRQ